MANKYPALNAKQTALIDASFALADAQDKSTEWALAYAEDTSGVDVDEICSYLAWREEQRTEHNERSL